MKVNNKDYQGHDRTKCVAMAFSYLFIKKSLKSFIKESWQSFKISKVL